MDTLRIGLVGTGFIAPFHFKGFAGIPEAQITGICSYADTEKLRRMASDWKIKAYESFDLMVSDPAIDALIVTSINTEHFSQTMKAIANGKHVLLEKPVVTDLAQLDEIQSHAHAAGVQVFPAHNFVYRKAVRRARQILDDGGIGKVLYSSIVSTHTIPEAHATGWRGDLAVSAGGTLMDSGHHLVYQQLFLRGMPAKLQAFKSRLVLTGMEGEDIAGLNLLYPDGSIGHILQSWTSQWGDGVNGIRLVGDKGNLIISDALYWNSEKIESDVEYADSFTGLAKAFTDCVLRGTPPLSDLDDARKALRLIYDAYESSDKGTVMAY